MGKTYRKNIRIGICEGTNTEFYRSRDRKIRRKNREICRGMVGDEDRDLTVMNDKYIKNDWEEPTDGTFVINDSTLNTYEDTEYTEYINELANKYLKSKRPWFRSKTA